jgi:predicted nucleic acid-binding protein
MALALEQRIPRVILDDLMARTFGRALGLEVVGTGAVLYLMVDTDLNRSLVPVDHEMGIAFL